MESKKLKILYIVGTTKMDGSTISFKIILEGMLSLDCDVVVLISNINQNSEFYDYMIQRGCIVEEFDAEMYIYPKCELCNWGNSFVKFPWRIIKKIYYINKSYLQIKKSILCHKPDIVHTNVGVFHQGLRACRKLGVPHLLHLREYQTKDFGWKIFPSLQLFKRKLNKTYVVAITNNILYYFDLQQQKTANAIWDGILPASQVIYKHDKAQYFICANRISAEKNLEAVIEAFAMIKDLLPNYKLKIVGETFDNNYYNKLLKLVTDLSCNELIEFHGFRQDVTDLMQDATALIVASNFEGLGRMTVEASFMGCLVLGRNTGGTKEIINITNGGYLFNNIGELSQQMVKTAKMAGTDEYKERVLKAQQISIEKFSNEQYCQKIYDLYIKIISENKNNNT